MLNKLETKSMVDARSAPDGPILFVHIYQFTDVMGGIARHLRDSFTRPAVLLHTGPLPNSKVYDLSPADFAETIDCQAVLVPRPRAECSSLPQLVGRAEEAERKYGIRILEMIRGRPALGAGFQQRRRYAGVTLRASV